MSLATDILKRAGVGLAKKKRKPGGHVASRELHMARVPGLYFRNHGWECMVRWGQKQRTIGTYQTIKRALVARKLWEYWRDAGVEPEAIPMYAVRQPYSRGRW